MVLLQVMAAANVKQLVFNSSATVFGVNPQVQYTEYLPIGAVNPYGLTKAMIEDMLRDLSAAYAIKPSQSPWKIALLRYFNPIGAHESGKIGETSAAYRTT